jgi:protein SCO1/2
MTVDPVTTPRSRARVITFVLIVLLLALSAIPIVALWRAFGPKVIVAPDFALIDQDARPFKLSGLRGHPVVVFFGYTHCPDVCPTTLAHLAKAVHSPTVPGDEHVVFITVDPDRDSPSVLKRYVRLFDPEFIGLTGSLKSLEPVYAAYHTARQAVPNNHGPNDYSIVHGTSLYYVGRDGIMKGFGSWEDDTPELTQDLKRFQ